MSNRIGTYAISTINYNDWMNAPIVNVTTKGKKGKPVKEIVNNIFQECSEITDDPFWKGKFEMAAIGKFPTKFSYHDGSLFYKRGAKTITVDVDNDPQIAANQCIDFFRTNGGIFSPTDEKVSIEAHQNKLLINEQRPPLEWSKINKKIKECLVSYYVKNLTTIMSLSPTESVQLLRTIKGGISYKLFGKHNIQLTDTKIYIIGGLLWDDEKRKFYIDPTLTPVVSRSTKSKKSSSETAEGGSKDKDRVPQFSTKWVKYIDTLDKKIDRTSKRIDKNKSISYPILTSQLLSQPRIKLNIIQNGDNYTGPTSGSVDETTSSTDDEYDYYDSDNDSYDSDYESD